MTVIDKAAYEKITRLLREIGEDHIDMIKLAEGSHDEPGGDTHFVYTVDGEQVETRAPYYLPPAEIADKVIKDEDDIIDLRQVSGPVDIRGGKGNDTIYGSKNGPNFLYGDGKWAFFEPNDTTVVANPGNDLIYGGNVFNIIYGGEGDDTIHGGTGYNVYEIKPGTPSNVARTIIYTAKGGKDYICFFGINKSNMEFGIFGNDLGIRCKNEDGDVINEVYIADFYKNNSVKKICDGSANFNPINQIIQEAQTNGTIGTQAMYNKIIKEMDKLQSIMDEVVPKTLTFNQYSMQDKSLRFAYECNEWDDSLSYNIRIFGVDGYNWEDTRDVESVVYYHDYLLPDNNSSLTITDKYDTYQVVSTNSHDNIDWSAGDEANKNHVVFIQGKEGKQEQGYSIISNNKCNMINTNDGTNMTYTYGGGFDRVEAQSSVSDDTYNVALTFNDDGEGHKSGTALHIVDAGGEKDTLNILSSINDVKLVFNLDMNEVGGGNDYLSGISNSIWLMHKDTFNQETLSKNGEIGWTPGIIEIDADDTGFAIERITSIENHVVTEVNTMSWAATIAENVAGWLTTNHYNSVADAFQACANGENVNLTGDGGLLNCYVSYNPEWSQPQP